MQDHGADMLLEVATWKCNACPEQENGRALKILPCGHTLCENCANLNDTCANGCENSFVKDAIPLVGMLFHVTDSNMKDRLEKRPEPDPRATVLRHYRRVREDHETEEEYNNYLEFVEDLILRYSEKQPKAVEEMKERGRMDARREEVQRMQRKECSDRDERFGEKPLAWQICPDISVWLPAAREPQAAASQVGLEVAEGLAGNREPQPLVRGDGDAGGFSESYQKMRDSVSAFEGLRQALKMAKLGSNVGIEKVSRS